MDGLTSRFWQRRVRLPVGIPGGCPKARSRLRKDLDEVAEFVLGVVGVGEGLAEFKQDGLAESFPEATGIQQGRVWIFDN